MNEQHIREAILDVIDAGDPRCANVPWEMYVSDCIDEDKANAQRLDFCDAVISKLNTPSLSPEDATKLESATIGESLRYEHLGDVMRARKQVS